MHRMWAEATTRALEASVGALPLARVLSIWSAHAKQQIGQRVTDERQVGWWRLALGAELSTTDLANLAMCCACLHDAQTWVQLIEAAHVWKASPSNLGMCIAEVIGRLTVGVAPTEPQLKRAVARVAKTAVARAASCASA